eukprot:GEMP01019779.1.p1 GENE.GEMP01019779.1~~GEMP01019779.1.p1  ORF type:complete len:224 (+),score=33.94 GEMP01019779.1:90-761(+)
MLSAIVRPTFRDLARVQLLRPYRAYERGVVRSPIVTKFLLGGILGGAGDLIVQWRQEKIDQRRLTAFTAFNAIFSCSANHFWFSLLDAKRLSIVRKVALQHLFFNPIVYLPAFYFAFGTMIGMPPSSCFAKFQAEALKTYALLLATWVPVSIVQFRFVPACHQVLFVSLINVGWNAILSMSTSSDTAEPKKIEDTRATRAFSDDLVERAVRSSDAIIPQIVKE